MEIFEKSFTQQEPLSEAVIERCAEILRGGRLHRYNLAAGELSEASQLEEEFAAFQGCDYCVATASGGQGIQLALRICDVVPGDRVLANAYTLAPVPGAIYAVGAEPVLVEIDHNYHIDCDDLKARATASGARVLLLSHMRGHIADMDRVMAVAKELNLQVIEDCAHTMGAKWKGVNSGNFGVVAAFSTQTYKHINSGEGGFVTTSDPVKAARAVVHSGSYMLYERHGARPPQSAFDRIHHHTANLSCRMDHLRAALIRDQLPRLAEKISRWNQLYDTLFSALTEIDGITIPQRAQAEFYVGSSLQFRTDCLGRQEIPGFVSACLRRGVELKWFGADQPAGFTSRYDSWKYLPDIPDLPQTKQALAKTMDMRLPLTFTPQDCMLIARIIAEELCAAGRG